MISSKKPFFQPESNMEKEGSSDEEPIVFLGGIPLTSSEEEIFIYVSQFDQVKNVFMPRFRSTGILKGYAKVTLASEKGVEKILSCQKHMLKGVLFGVFRWRKQTEYLNSKDQKTTKKVYIKYKSHITCEDIRKFYSQFGPIVDISIRTDPLTNKPRNFCYVLFAEDSAAKAAVQTSPHHLKGSLLVCEMSKPAYLEPSTRRGTFYSNRKQSSSKNSKLLTAKNGEKQHKSQNIGFNEKQANSKKNRRPNFDMNHSLGSETSTQSNSNILKGHGKPKEVFGTIEEAQIIEDKVKKRECKFSSHSLCLKSSSHLKPTSKKYWSTRLSVTRELYFSYHKFQNLGLRVSGPGHSNGSESQKNSSILKNNPLSGSELPL